MPQTQQPLPMMQPHETDAATQRRRRLRDGSVTRRTFAPFASAQFRRIVQGHYIAQEAKSIAAVGGLSLPRRVWKERDPRRLGVGSVIRRTFAPLRRAPFRLSGPGHCIVQDRKSSRAMRGLSSPRCAWTGKDRRVVGDGSVTRRTFAPLRRASFRLVLHLHFCGQDRKSSRAMRGLCSQHRPASDRKNYKYNQTAAAHHAETRRLGA